MELPKKCCTLRHVSRLLIAAHAGTVTCHRSCGLNGEKLVATYLLLTRQEKFKIKRSRIMWYIEWYSESPYELPVLYWCVRLLQVIIYNRDPKDRRGALQDLFDTHGVIIIIRNVFSLQFKINHDMSKLFI